MTKISSYEPVSVPTLSDKLIGTDVNNANKTVNFTIEDILSLGAITSVTFTELQTLMVNGDLIVGGLYVISDFQTIYDQPDFNSLGVAKTIVATKTGPIEPLIVRAVSDNAISDIVFSTLYPNDTIKYDVTFTQTEVMGVVAKGRITLRGDENNNILPYDHRVVVFKRYLDPATDLFTIINDNGLNSNSLIPTFGTNCYNNNMPLGGTDGGAFLLSNNVFGDSCTNNTFRASTCNNTFGSAFQFNNLGDYVKNNTFGDSCLNNDIAHSCFNNKIGNDFANNKIYANIQNNIILNNFQRNDIRVDIINKDLSNTLAYKDAYCQIIKGFDVEEPSVDIYIVWLDINTGTFTSQPI